MAALRVAFLASVLLHVCAAQLFGRNPKHYFNVFCKLGEEANLSCEVDTRDVDPEEVDTCIQDEWDFCGAFTK